jgi:ribosomal protein S18 acetylase RimI-like enzyme
MTTGSGNRVTLAPASICAFPDTLARIRDSFADHLVVDRGTAPDDAQRQAAEICTRELSETLGGARNDFLSIRRNAASVGVLWKTERMIDGVKTWHILYLETLPAYRRQGIAEAAMGQLFDLARTAQVARITLNVSQRNSPAVALYSKLGFAPRDGGYALSIDHRGDQISSGDLG